MTVEYEDVHVLVHPYYCGPSEYMEDGFYENYVREVAKNPKAVLLVISDTTSHRVRGEMSHAAFHPKFMQDKLARYAKGVL